METRKIQSVGGGTYTVSIPKDWADEQGITTGDTVGLHRHIDGILAIQTPERTDTGPSQITVHLTPAETDAIEHTLRAAYAAGTKEVRLENPETFTAQQRRIVSCVARNLTGVSVVEDNETEMVVRTLLATDEVSVTQSVRQLRFVVLSMHRDGTATMTGDGQPAQLAERDDQADRLHAMISRSFARGIRRLDEIDALGVTRPELFELWATTRELERVGDHADGITTVARLVDDTVDRDTVAKVETLADRSREIVSDAVSVLIDDAGVDTARQALAARDAVREDIATLDDSASLRLRPVCNRIRRTAEHGGNIAEIGLQKAIRSGELDSLEQTIDLSGSPSRDSPAWVE